MVIGTYENDCNNGKYHDCVTLFCRYLRLLSGPSSFANIGMLLLQIKQMVKLRTRQRSIILERYMDTYCFIRSRCVIINLLDITHMPFDPSDNLTGRRFALEVDFGTH